MKGSMKRKAKEGEEWVAFWVRCRRSTRDLLDRLLLKLWRESGQRQKKVTVIEEAIVEKARKHKVR